MVPEAEEEVVSAWFRSQDPKESNLGHQPGTSERLNGRLRMLGSLSVALCLLAGETQRRA